MGRAVLSKSLFCFSVGVIPPCYLPEGKLCGGNEDNGGLLQKVPCMHGHTQCPRPCSRSLPTHCLHWRLLDTHRQVWVSLLWSYCSFLLGPGAHKVLFVPSKGLFLQSCVSSIIKSHWPPKSNYLGVLSPFARSPGWEICCGS